MSRRKDRERAEAGMIHRFGKLIPKVLPVEEVLALARPVTRRRKRAVPV